MEKVLSWNEALESGCEPSHYNYGNAPEGVVTAVLDFKIWAKDTMAIVCYFTDIETGDMFLISVFRLKDKTYKLPGGEVDFTVCPSGRQYRLTIAPNSKGNLFLKDCRMIV